VPTSQVAVSPPTQRSNYTKPIERGSPKKEKELEKHVAELCKALSQLQQQLNELLGGQKKKSKGAHFVPAAQTGDCEHWRRLLDTHVKVVRVLEVKDAQMGVSLPAFERIELSECSDMNVKSTI
jgi:hypothetical protein